jgi:hypothetical protein
MPDGFNVHLAAVKSKNRSDVQLGEYLDASIIMVIFAFKSPFIVDLAVF